MEPIQSAQLFEARLNSGASEAGSADPTDLGSRLIAAIGKGNTDMANMKHEMNKIISSPDLVSNPQSLMKYHAKLAELSVQTTAAKTFASKVAVAVEMVIKS